MARPQGSFLAQLCEGTPLTNAALLALSAQGDDGSRNGALLVEILSAILNRLPANICLLDRQGTVVDVNDDWRAFAASNGYRYSGFGVGTNYLSVCHAASNGAAKADVAAEIAAAAVGLREVLSGRSERMDLNYSACHSPQEQRWFKCLARAVRLGGEIAGAVVMHVNVSDLVRLYSSIADAVVASKDANATAAPVYEAEASERLRATADDLLGIINRVIEQSRLGSGAPDPAPIDLALCQERVLTLLERERLGRGISLEADFGDDLPLLLVDESLLRQILIGLLSSSLRHTPAGGRVEISGSLAPGGWLRLDLSSSGAGLADSQLRRILQPFEASPAPALQPAEPDDAGLGLPLTKTLVELHDGSFEIESRNGGTQIAIGFPPERLLRGASGAGRAASEPRVHLP